MHKNEISLFCFIWLFFISPVPFTYTHRSYTTSTNIRKDGPSPFVNITYLDLAFDLEPSFSKIKESKVTSSTEIGQTRLINKTAFLL